jgi:vacuolar protein-sorting-associated protein 4
MSNDALMAPVRNLNKTKTWVEVIDQGKVKYAPYDENLPEDPNHKYFHGLVDELKAKGHTIYLTTKYSDFIKALKSSKPSVSQGDLHKYIEWTKTFGIDG